MVKTQQQINEEQWNEIDENIEKAFSDEELNNFFSPSDIEKNKKGCDSLSILDNYFEEKDGVSAKKSDEVAEKIKQKERENKMKKAQAEKPVDRGFGTVKQTEDTYDGLIRAQVEISRVLFPKTVAEMQENDYKIMACELVHLNSGKEPELNNFGNFVVKGLCPFYQIGDQFTVVLEEGWNEKFGNKDYTIVHSFRDVKLDTREDQYTYLEYILTPSQLNKIYDTFDNPFELIKEGKIDELVKAKGIGVATAEKLIERYKETIDNSHLFVALRKYNLKSKMIEKLMEKYKSPDLIIKKIEENPYILATEVDGIGFKKADEIAMNSGIDPKGVFRIQGFIQSLLKEYGNDGHMWIPPAELFGIMLETLVLDRDEELDRNIKTAMNNLYERKRIWYNEDKTKVALMGNYLVERGVADELIRLQNAPEMSVNRFIYGDTDKVLKDKEFTQGWEYTDEQREAIEMIKDNQVLFITGKAGTGKSTVVDGILSLLSSGGHHYNVAQTALSGRASARLAEVTGKEGHTIHRLLKFNPEQGWEHDKNNQLGYDVIIVDEISMVGVDLFKRLVEAIYTGAKLILLGDVAQLEAIGLGNLAEDLIQSGAIPVKHLTKIHRQAQKSSIVTDSIKVSEGKKITERGWKGVEVRGELQDLEVNIYDDNDQSQRKVLDYFKEHLRRVNNVMEVQVLTPVKSRGSICTKELNPLLQDIYNPDDGKKDFVEVQRNDKKDDNFIIRVGDKVINRKNDYKAMGTNLQTTPVFNGDLGIVRSISKNKNTLEVVIEFERVGDIIFTETMLKNVELAYAITIHSFQGSQAEHTICVLDYSAYVLLTRQMLYTILTRAKKYCVLVAESGALNHAIETSHVPNKRTFLAEFLREGLTTS